MDDIEEAYQEYVARQERSSHPEGDFDNAGRWYPSDGERQKCCERIREPSRRWPLSLNKHCRSVRHVAALFGVEESDLRRYAKEQSPITSLGAGEEYPLYNPERCERCGKFASVQIIVDDLAHYLCESCQQEDKSN